jgi:hypothetical protein
MVRKIRDKMYQETKKMPPEKLMEHIRAQAGRYQSKNGSQKHR